MLVALTLPPFFPLCSLRCPRAGGRDRQPEPWGADAKEFLRKKLIGREVDVQMEYNRKVPAAIGVWRARGGA